MNTDRKLRGRKFNSLEELREARIKEIIRSGKARYVYNKVLEVANTRDKEDIARLSEKDALKAVASLIMESLNVRREFSKEMNKGELKSNLSDQKIDKLDFTNIKAELAYRGRTQPSGSGWDWLFGLFGGNKK